MHPNKTISQQPSVANQWAFHVDGYMTPYSEGASYANDWLKASFNIQLSGQEYSFPLNHLLIEELEDFVRWLTILSDNMPEKRLFQFIDANLCFEAIEEKGMPILRLIYGYENEEQILLDINVGKDPSFIQTQIEKINKLLEQFPCRCHEEHHLFEHAP
jgi:hypothetical protein